jgi:hypothetical protein
MFSIHQFKGAKNNYLPHGAHVSVSADAQLAKQIAAANADLNTHTILHIAVSQVIQNLMANPAVPFP